MCVCVCVCVESKRRDVRPGTEAKVISDRQFKSTKESD